MLTRRSGDIAGNAVHTSAQEWSNLSRIHILRNTHCGFSPKSCILAISALTVDAVDRSVVASLELTTIARSAGTIVATVPGSADAVTDFPFLL